MGKPQKEKMPQQEELEQMRGGVKRKEKAAMQEGEKSAQKEKRQKTKEAQQQDNKKAYRGYRYLGKSLKYYRPYKLGVFGILFFGLAAGAVGLLHPILTAELVTNITIGNMDKVIEYGLYVFLLSLGMQTIWGSGWLTLYSTNFKVRSDLRSDLAKNTLNLRVNDFDQTNSGKFISRLSTDSTVMSTSITNGAMDITWGLSNIVFIVYICIESLYLGIFMVAMLVIVFAVNAITLKIYKKNSKVVKYENDILNGLFNESVRGVRDVKLLGIKENTLAMIGAQQAVLTQKEKKHKYTHTILRRIQNVTSNALQFVFLVLGAYLVTNSMLTIGVFLVVYFYRDRIINLAETINGVQENLTEAEVSAERVYDILEPVKEFRLETFGEVDHKSYGGGVLG